MPRLECLLWLRHRHPPSLGHFPEVLVRHLPPRTCVRHLPARLGHSAPPTLALVWPTTMHT